MPLLAETTAIVAGASPLGWRRRASLTALAGSLPGALLCALTRVAEAASFRDGALVFGLAFAVAAFSWLVGRRLGCRSAGSRSTTT